MLKKSKENIFYGFFGYIDAYRGNKMKMVNQFKMVLVFLISYLIILKELKIPRIKMQRTPQRLKSQSLKNQSLKSQNLNNHKIENCSTTLYNILMQNKICISQNKH